MTVRWFALLAVAGVALGVFAWSLTGVRGSDLAAPTDHGGRTAGTTGGATGGATVGATSGTGSTTPGHRAGGGRTSASEVLPSPSSTGQAGGEGLPGVSRSRRPHADATALVTAPLPREAAATGALVAGFPHALNPPATHAVIISSVASADHVLQASLTATCRRSCNVLRLYRTRLAKRGFTEVTVPSIGNRPTAALRHGQDSVTITVTAHRSGSTTYAVFAVLHTQG